MKQSEYYYSYLAIQHQVHNHWDLKYLLLHLCEIRTTNFAKLIELCSPFHQPCNMHLLGCYQNSWHLCFVICCFCYMLRVDSV